MDRYTNLLNRRKAQWGENFSPRDLAPQFVDAYNKGDIYRILVDIGDAKPIWGFVNVTMGWIPAFLLMRRRGQIGSSIVLYPSHKILKARTIKP